MANKAKSENQLLQQLETARQELHDLLAEHASLREIYGETIGETLEKRSLTTVVKGIASKLRAAKDGPGVDTGWGFYTQRGGSGGKKSWLILREQ